MLWIALALAQETELDLEGRHYRLVSGGVEVTEGGSITFYAAPNAVGLFLADNQVWVSVETRSALPVSGLVVLEAPVQEGAEAAVAAGARVVGVEGGNAILDQGSLGGLKPGDTVRFLGQRSVAAGDNTLMVEQEVAVGRVRNVEENRALVELARGGRVEAGDLAEKRPNAWHYPMAPERLGGVKEVGGTIRPFLGINTLGGGALMDAWAGWTFEGPWYARVQLDPIGLGFSKKGAAFVGGGTLSGGYETRYFSVGLGGGTWTEEYVSGDMPRLAIVQEARLGGQDGLSIRVRNTFLLSERYEYYYDYDEFTGEETRTVIPQGSAFIFGGISIDLNIPTGHRTDLVGAFHIDQEDSLWVEGGISTWLVGGGDAGSTGIRVAAGYGSLGGYSGEKQTELYGPLVSFGVRYRF